MSEYFRPVPKPAYEARDAALPLAGSGLFFDKIEVLTRNAASRIISAEAAPAEVLARLTAPRAGFAGLDLSRPNLMGILNVTPDSFSDGGAYHRLDQAVAQAQALVEEGADLIDIGGESTRPGAQEVAIAEEIARIEPVIAAIRAAGISHPISVDTRKAAVARAALAAGADIVNDVSGFRFDPDMAHLVAETGAPVIVMHSLGTPKTMQAQAHYGDVVLDVYDALEATLNQAEAAGIARARIMIDPGIGFGKTQEHNLALLRRLSLFHGLGVGVLLGVSRKGFIGQIGVIPDAKDRDPASAALGLWAACQGMHMLRVHDIRFHKQALALAAALQSEPGEPGPMDEG